MGNAAFWLQSVRSQLIGVTWSDLCERVCARFTKDRQHAMIRQWLRVKQTASVAEYVEKFDAIMHQLNAYESTAPPDYFVTKFIDGLKDEVRSVVLVQRPQDLDTACSVALLQEEALEGLRTGNFKKSDQLSNYIKSSTRSTVMPTTPTSTQQRVTFTSPEPTRPKEDRVSALKAYRKSKGLCFICGERWGRDHKCANSVQLNVVQELMEALHTDSEVSSDPATTPEEEEEVNLLAISQQALNGTESRKSIRLKGWIQGTELLMLVDSGSTNSFIDEQIGNKLNGVEVLQKPLRVQIVDGGQLECTKVIPGCTWWMQGHSFKNDFTLIPLGNYDIILGMDWLTQHSPMQIDWNKKWVEFQYNQQLIRLMGINSKP